MFVRLKSNGNEVNVMVASVKTFAPNTSGTGSVITFTDNTSLAVEETTRTLRHQFKKLAQSSSEETPEPAPAA